VARLYLLYSSELLRARVIGPLLLVWMLFGAGGCATIRVTDSPRTADEEFLLTEAATRAVGQLSLDALRGRTVFVLTEYAFATSQPYSESFFTNQVLAPSFADAFMVAELRARLLKVGARLSVSRDNAEVILEVRAGALAINRVDFLLGIPALVAFGASSQTLNNLAVATPNLAIYQSIRQDGYGSVSVVGYWRNTGDILVNSGPFVGHTHRYDYFLFGYALQPVGDIPPTQVGGPSK
jgi:hypothetical protein